MSGPICLNCGAHSTYRRGRCQTCYRYLLKHGEDLVRTEQQQLALNARRLERELVQRLVSDVIAAAR